MRYEQGDENVLRTHVTGAGWVLYERESARYRELYRDVDAPDPKRVGAAVGERL